MRLARVLAASMLLVGSLACSALVGFDDFERVDHIGPTDSGKAAPSSGDAGDVPPPTPDSGSPSADSGPDGSGIPPASKTCPAPAATSYPPWTSPPTRPKPCTAQDITTFVANETRSFDQQKAAIAATNAACASCVFTLQSDAIWGPVTHTNDDRIFVDFGLCYRVAGASDPCGAAAHELEWCIQKVCNVCVDGQTLDDCRTAVKAGTCKTRFDTTVSVCNGFATIVDTTCAASGDVVGVLCGGT
jgi:hypothetical protein